MSETDKQESRFFVLSDLQYLRKQQKSKEKNVFLQTA